MAVAAILDLFESQIAPFDSPSPQNPTLEPNMKWIGSPVAEIWPFAYGGGIWNLYFKGGKGRSLEVSGGTIRKSDGSFL